MCFRHLVKMSWNMKEIWAKLDWIRYKDDDCSEELGMEESGEGLEIMDDPRSSRDFVQDVRVQLEIDF
jgi:hypothetical protein